jgi:hypothetical protein
MGAFGLRIGLRHIRAFFGLAVIRRPVAVVDIARRIDPHHARPPSRCLRHCSCLRRRGGFCRGCRSRSRSRSWRWGRSLRRWRRCSRRRRSCGWSLRRCRRSLRIPLLHPLVSPTSPLFAGGGRISSILALSGRPCWCLSHGYLRCQKAHRNRHQTNRYLHKRSR